MDMHEVAPIEEESSIQSENEVPGMTEGIEASEFEASASFVNSGDMKSGH